MNKRKLNRVFDEIRIKAHMDYAVTNADKYGDCCTCVTYELGMEFGEESTGIFAKHWLKGMNRGCAWASLDSVYISHDITEEQANIMVQVLEENGYTVAPREYDPCKCFKIKE